MYLGASLNFRGEWNILPQMPNILSLFALGIFPGVSARALAAPSKCSLWPGSGGPWASASKGVAVAGAALWAGARAAVSGCPVGMPPSRPVNLSLRVEPGLMPLCASVRERSSATSWPPTVTLIILWPARASFLILALVQRRAGAPGISSPHARMPRA